MKQVILTIFALPLIFLIIYLFGLLASRPKTKLKLFSIALFISLVCSFPIIGKFIQLPLNLFYDKIKNDNYSEINNIIVLTGGIYKNTLGDWLPSNSTEKRIFLVKKVLNKKNVPLIISGGFSKKDAPSEAALARNYFNLYNSIIEQNSLNTYQSALNLKHYCSKNKGKFLLITDKYHALRSFLTFKGQNCDVVLLNNAINITASDFIPNLTGYNIINKAIYEYLGIIYYFITFKISLF
jgi:uncharacterized SAM-binding protein YcdF (DUF218 family)